MVMVGMIDGDVSEKEEMGEEVGFQARIFLALLVCLSLTVLVFTTSRYVMRLMTAVL